MKKLNLFLIIVVLLITQSAFSQNNWMPFNGSEPGFPVVTIEEQDMNGLTLDITVPGLFTEEVIYDGITYHRLTFEAWQTLHEVGMPELPIITEMIAIPGDKLVQVKVLETESVTLDNMLVYPFQTPSKDILNGQYTGFDIDEGFYAQDNAFPGVIANTNDPGIWRDVKVAGLHICPFQYKAASRQLEAITHIKLRVEFYGTDTEVVLNRSKNISASFYEMYTSKIINFESMGYAVENISSNSDIKYLIITNTNPLSTLEPFIDWKNRQGFHVEVRTKEAGFNTPQEFKDYITQLYNSDNLEYVLMVGDAYPNGGNNGGPDEVPMFWWAPSGEDPSYSDSWYTCLDGPDDHFADLAIGRFTYDNLSELALQIEKTLNYYQAPDATSNWAENTLLVAHKENYPSKYTECKNEIKNFNYSMQTPIFTECYGGAGASNQTIIDYINNNSCGIFNYRGHGSATELWEWGASGSFKNSHIQQLTNEDRLFVLFDVCCDNMDIVAHPGDCLCESFMKSPVAAVAINGAIIPSYTIPNHDYDKEMYKAVFHEGIYNIGYITNFANVTVINAHGTIGRSNVRTYLWLGDASIEPWTLQPTEMDVAHLPTLFLGFNEFTVEVIAGGNPVEGARVCITNEDLSLYAIAFTDATGIAIVDFGGPVQTPGTATIVVSAHNFIPYITDIPIIPLEGAYIIQNEVTINDEAGNNNGMMDYSESILLTLEVKNIGSDDGENIDVTVTTDNSYITMTSTQADFGTVPAGETKTIDDAFAFDVAENIPDLHTVIFDVEATNGTDTWHSTFVLKGHAPILAFLEVTIDDATGNGNGKLDPGETANLMISVGNNGTADAYDVLGDLLSSDPYVTINTASLSYGEIASGSDGVQSYNITTSITTPAGHGLDFTIDIDAFGGISAQGMFSLIVGQMPILIIDLDGVPQNSGAQMKSAIQDLGIGVEYTQSWPEDVNLYSNLFVCLGIYSYNHKLSQAEGQDLADYLDAGGNVYMEGGDTWYYDEETPVHPMFNINKVSDGSDDMSVLLGQNGTFTEGMTFNYGGDNNYMDHITAIAPAFEIFENNSPSYFSAVAYHAGSYRTIGCAFEFGGMANGSGISTRLKLMEEYLNFFGIRKVNEAPGTPAGAEEVCANSINPYLTNSVDGADFYYWTIEPNTAGTVNGTDTAVMIAWSADYYGMAYVRVCGMNNTGVGPQSDSLIVMIVEAPTAIISGNEEICEGDEVGLMIDLTGVAPWSLVIDNESYTANSTPWTFNVSPTASTTYTITSVQDAVGCNNSGTGSAQVEILPLPEIAGTPSGPEMVNTDDNPTTVYTTSGAINASSYSWLITPADAYSDIAVNDMDVTITWSGTYAGPITIKARGMNNCGPGLFSDEINVTLENTFGIDELASVLGLSVYPNPNSGSFTLELSTERVNKVNVRIVNAIGNMVYEDLDLAVNSNFSTLIDISNEAEGLYLMVVESGLGVHTSRIILRK